jgi:plastocyanin
VTTPVISGATGTTEVAGRPPLATLGLLGLTLLTATLLVFGALVAFMFPEEAGFILPPLAIVGIVTALVWRKGATWTHVLGVLATLALGAMMFWIAFGLAHPASFFDFVPSVMFVLGVVLSLVGNIGAIARRKHRRPASGTEQRVLQATVGIVVVAVLASGTMSLLGRDQVDPATVPDAIAVGMSNFEFEPLAIEAPAGGQLLVHNGDAFMHDFAIPALDIHADVRPGSRVLIDVPTTPGTYVVYCTLHSDTSDPDPDPDGAMVARLTVR